MGARERAATRPWRARSASDANALRAVLWMIGGIAGYMPIPLVVWAGVREMSPFFFVAVWYGARAGVQAILRQSQIGWGNARGRFVMADDLAAVKSGHLWMTAFLQAEWLLFALAVTLVQPVVATVIYEFWPVVFAMVTLTATWRAKMLERPHTHKRAITTSAKNEEPGTGTRGSGGMLVLLLFGGIGVSFAVMSESAATGWTGTAALGVLLAALSVSCAALSIALFQLMGASRGDGSDIEQTAVSTSGNAAAQAFAAPFIAVIGMVAAILGFPVGWTAQGVAVAVTAGAIQVAAGWCFQHANHLSRRAHGRTSAQINSLYYLTPVGALLLLVAFADTTIERPDLLIIGAAGVVVVNMILHLDPEGAQRRAGRVGGHGYRALVLALWGAGAAVLLRDDWLPAGWQVWSVVEYWGVIGVCATVFTLILSFRQSRLADRRREMDALMLSLHRQITFMGECGDLDVSKAEEATSLLRDVDTAQKPLVLSEAYFQLRKLLMGEMSPSQNREHAERLSRILTDVEVLVNLRQQGRNFTELAVLTLFASLTVALAVAARPAGGLVPFAGWVHDTTSLVIAAAFAFLGFDLIDKRREADAPILREVSRIARERHRQPPGWRLELVSYQDKSAERAVASLVGAVLLVGAVVMLGFKWL